MSAEDETLHDAITARLQCDDPNALVTHFIVIAVGAGNDGATPYYMAFSGGEQPLWQSLGLLETGKSLLIENSPHQQVD